MSLKSNIRLFLALQEGLHSAISPANMSHQDYSNGSGKFSFDSCLLISDANTVRILRRGGLIVIPSYQIHRARLRKVVISLLNPLFCKCG